MTQQNEAKCPRCGNKVAKDGLSGEFHFCPKCREEIDGMKEALSKMVNFSALQPPKETHDASKFLVLSLAEVGILYKCHECHEELAVSLGDMHCLPSTRCFNCGGMNIYPACVKISVDKLREKAEQIKKIVDN